MAGYQALGETNTFRIAIRHVAMCTTGAMLITFFMTILWSIRYHFEASTATHCRVDNYLPSISAAIGSFTPQRYFWRIGIAFHAGPRFLSNWLYYCYFSLRLTKVGKEWSYVVKGATLLNLVEVVALIGLSYVSSTENYQFHEKCFITFVGCSETYMVLSCVMFKHAIPRIPSAMEQKSLRVKRVLAVSNIGSFLLAVYFFFRHNWYCETGVYTLFALCEYFVVLTNIAFHTTAYWDFHDRDLVMAPNTPNTDKLR